MADTIAEKILANVVTTLTGITIAAGYNNTVKLVSRDPIMGLDNQFFPSIFVVMGSDDPEPGLSSVNFRNMNLTLEAWVRKEKDVGKAAESLRGDIQKAMMVDPRRNATAVNTIERGSSFLLHMSEVPEAAFQIAYQIDYSTKIEDPFSAPA